MIKDLLDKKLFLKAVIYRICAFCVIFLLSLFITGNGIIAGAISILELISKLVLYYLYELAWKKFTKGE